MSHVKARHYVMLCGADYCNTKCWRFGGGDNCRHEDIAWNDCEEGIPEVGYIEGEFGCVEVTEDIDGECVLRLGKKRLGKTKYQCEYLEVDGYVYCGSKDGQTCTVDGTYTYLDGQKGEQYVFQLSCHTVDGWWDSEPPDYCPYCGRKVEK